MSDGLGSNVVHGVFAAGTTVYAATAAGLSTASWEEVPAVAVSVKAGSASVSYGTRVPAIGYTSTPSTLDSSWSTKPSCGVYATSDTGFATKLTGVLTVGTYVTRCSGGESTSYSPVTYVKGSFRVNAVKPGAPTRVSVVAGDRSVTVSWTAPVSTGGAAVTQYVATASPGGASCLTNGAGRSCVVSGLTAGKGYTFKVTAKNSAGVGAASSVSAKVTALALPGKVRNLLVVGVTAAGVVNLKWSAPLDNGGSRITGYRVRYSVAGSSDFTSYGDVRSASAAVKGLPKGTYFFSVRAITAAGVGDFVVTPRGASVS